MIMNMPEFITLECESVNNAQPTPVRTWFKDGEVVYSETVGFSIDLDSEYLMQRPILTPGVLNPITLTLLSAGTVIYNYLVFNITMPQALPDDFTLQQARQEVFEILLGTWTCIVNNTLGSTPPITYTIRECGKCCHQQSTIT